MAKKKEKIKELKINCPNCNKEMKLLEINWKGDFVFKCDNCELFAYLYFWERNRGKMHRKDLNYSFLSKIYKD